jgi:hypothetical protein
MVIYRCIALITLAFLPAIALSQVFSWKDESGKIHYGDRPPTSKQAGSRKLADPPPVDAEANRKALVDRQLADQEKQKKAQEESKKAQENLAEAKEREENCQLAKANLAGIESGQIRSRINTKGERIDFDDATRNAELTKARKAVEGWCVPPAQAK